jgi:hypothetical protein
VTVNIDVRGMKTAAETDQLAANGHIALMLMRTRIFTKVKVWVIILPFLC